MLPGGTAHFRPVQGCGLQLLLVRAREWFRELCRGSWGLGGNSPLMASSGAVSSRGSGVAPCSERGRLRAVHALAEDPVCRPWAASFPGGFLESAPSLHSGPFPLGLHSGSNSDSIPVAFPCDVGETRADMLVVLSTPGSRAKLCFPMNLVQTWAYSRKQGLLRPQSFPGFEDEL